MCLLHFFLPFFNLQDLLLHLTVRRMRYKTNLYPIVVVFSLSRQCMSVISCPVWIQGFRWVPPFANFYLLFLPHNTAHSPLVSLCLTPTQGVTQSIQMCIALKPHYLAPDALFNTIKRTDHSWELRALHCPCLLFSASLAPLLLLGVGQGVTVNRPA